MGKTQSIRHTVHFSLYSKLYIQNTMGGGGFNTVRPKLIQKYYTNRELTEHISVLLLRKSMLGVMLFALMTDE